MSIEELQAEVARLREQNNALEAQFRSQGIVPYLDRMRELAAKIARLREKWYNAASAEDEAMSERDEAREAARTLFTEDCQYRLPADSHARLERWPWLDKDDESIQDEG